MPDPILDLVLKYGSNLTVAGVLFWVVKSLKIMLLTATDKYEVLVKMLVENHRSQVDQYSEQYKMLQERAQELLDGERERFEAINKYERAFMLELMEKKDTLIEQKDQKIMALIRAMTPKENLGT